MLKIFQLIFVLLLCLPKLAVADQVLLSAGLKTYSQADYENSAVIFQRLADSPQATAQMRAQANYYLGLSLYQLKLYQASSYPLIKALKSGSQEYKQKALLRLVAVSNKLNNQRMLDLALADATGVNLSVIPQDIYLYQSAGSQYEKNNVDKAISLLTEAVQKNERSEASLNLLAISYLRKNNTDAAVKTYEKLLGLYAAESEAHTQKSYTRLNLARAYFQAKKYAEAISQYDLISKNSAAYRESLTEKAWAYLHSNQYQKALGALQNLHTPFYENYFDPESLFLRVILLNYLCQFNEAEAAIKAFNLNYSYISDLIDSWTTQAPDYARARIEIEYAQEVLRSEVRDKKISSGLVREYSGKIPFKVTRSILKDNRLSSAVEAVQQLQEESVAAYKIFKGDKLVLKPYLEQIYKSRSDYYENQIAQSFHKLLKNTKTNIDYFKDQLTFAGYEITDAKKIQLRQKTLPPGSVKWADNREIQSERKLSRRQYEKAGRQYWPMSGEIWKDEIGSYLYFGENNCAQE